jgi:hypothetical protein
MLFARCVRLHVSFHNFPNEQFKHKWHGVTELKYVQKEQVYNLHMFMFIFQSENLVGW